MNPIISLILFLLKFCFKCKTFFSSKVLLVTSTKNRNHWVVPGGGIENGENPMEAAVREVYEEVRSCFRKLFLDVLALFFAASKYLYFLLVH